MAFHPPMNMGERILYVRENCGDLSQEEFAQKLGLTKSAISGYETGRRIPPDNVLKHIACEFGIDEDWLRFGNGEPFVPTPDDYLEGVFNQFECSDFERAFLGSYFSLSEKERRVFCGYLESVFRNTARAMKWTVQGKPAQEPKNIHHWTDAEMHAELQRQLDAEKEEADESSTSFSGNSGTATA